MKKVVGVLLLLISFGLIGYGSYSLLQPKTYVVKFTGVDESIKDVSVEDGQLVPRPNDPVKNGYKFVAWYSNGKVYDFSSPVTGNLTLEANWKEISKEKNEDESYKVIFKDDDGTVIDEVVIDKEIKVVSKPDDPVKEGYKFIGWYKNNLEYDFNKEVTSNLELVAKYEKIESYTVTFNTDGGNSIKSITIDEGSIVSKPTNPTKKGYKFVEWQLDGKAYNFSTKVKKNITLKAIWKKEEEKKSKYTVTFNTDGGTSIKSVIVNEGSTVAKPVNNPTKTGYKFVEWQLDGKAYNFSTKVTKNITLKAIWKKSVSYTVTFDSNGGSIVPNVTINEGYKITAPNPPTKEGAKFIEWQLNGVKFDFNTQITKNITLVAYYEEEK